MSLTNSVFDQIERSPAVAFERPNSGTSPIFININHVKFNRIRFTEGRGGAVMIRNAERAFINDTTFENCSTLTGACLTLRDLGNQSISHHRSDPMID
jgi:hypothetical protein